MPTVSPKPHSALGAFKIRNRISHDTQFHLRHHYKIYLTAVRRLTHVHSDVSRQHQVLPINLKPCLCSIPSSESPFGKLNKTFIKRMTPTSILSYRPRSRCRPSQLTTGHETSRCLTTRPPRRRFPPTTLPCPIPILAWSPVAGPSSPLLIRNPTGGREPHLQSLEPPTDATVLLSAFSPPPLDPTQAPHPTGVFSQGRERRFLGRS